MWRKGLVAPRHVGSSRTRDRTCVPCIGRQILNHCATREALNKLFLNLKTEWAKEELVLAYIGEMQIFKKLMLLSPSDHVLITRMREGVRKQGTGEKSKGL